LQALAAVTQQIKGATFKGAAAQKAAETAEIFVRGMALGGLQ